jgi:hypothetical protein
VKGSVYRRGSTWTYRFRAPEKDPSTGDYPWITKGGLDTRKEAWTACRDTMREADHGRVVRPSTRTVAQFFREWFSAIEPAIDPRPGRTGRTMGCRLDRRQVTVHDNRVVVAGHARDKAGGKTENADQTISIDRTTASACKPMRTS